MKTPACSFRFALLCGVLLLSAHAALGGKYLRTLDKKAHIWNDDPKPGDEATWSGKHDEQDFASGPGTLTWYHAEQGPSTRTTFFQEKLHVVSNLTGTMLRGRWEGTVEAIDVDGRISHARFENGKLTEPWSEGHSPPEPKAKPVSEESKPKQEPAKSTPEPERWSEPAKLPDARPAETVHAAQAAAPAKVETKPQVDISPSSTIKNAFDTPVLFPPTTPSPAATSHTITSSAPSTPRSTKASTPLPTTPSSGSSLLSNPVLPSQPSSATGDDLLHSLAAPPSLLRHKATLTPREAAKIAEVELAREGYILSDYPRRQISYDPDGDMWIFSYAHDPASTSAAGPPQFGVTVEDKTAKATLRAAP